ncbi:carbohydrate binding family 9 domain-containing protein [Rhodohalobacter sp. 614A]|uniref:carbohydrate binding family 9 domain-containing protein n=1 Tax=Rhodohalobacter sp. 614A TaxID=2908649 RepID=UPI001F391276
MNISKSILATFLLFCLIGPLHAQKINEGYQLHIKKASSAIRIDGAISEQAWDDAEIASNFYMITPMDTSYAELRTDVRMTYDDEHLYILVENYRAGDNPPNVVESLRRDFNFSRNDNFLLAMDTFDDKTNGFSFGANAGGAEWDGMMYNGGSMNLSWDNKWISKVTNYEDKWVFEAAIPFKSIRYNDENTKWGINFSRYDLTEFEKSSWAPVPRQFPSVSLAFTGYLIWDEPPPPAGSNISIIPHVLGGINHDFEEEDARSYERDAGLNAKIGLSSSMNLDLTVNPDFSQVEVDEQIIDLDRFELFFPEKRQFFLENEDLFASFGNQNIRPFFSRRIGLDAPIHFGGRLSGQLNRDWRLGVMNMQTGSVDNQQLPSQNFSVVALKRRVASRSNLGFLFVNMESTGDDYTGNDGNSTTPGFDRNVGIEYNLATSNNLWTGDFMLLKSFSPGDDGKSVSHLASLLYSDGNLTAEWAHEYVGEDYTAKVGYVPRKGYIRWDPAINYLFYPKRGIVLNHGPGFDPSIYFDESFNTTEYEGRLEYNVNFRSGSSMYAWFGRTYIELLEPFDPSGISDLFLETGSVHDGYRYALEFNSKAQSAFTYGFAVENGGFYANGTLLSIETEVGYRFQPFVNIVLSTSYNDLGLPEPWGDLDFWLVGSRLDITFNKNLYFTSFTQYNEQFDNVNINTRLQWRFQPASDLFIVYTDNYVPGSFDVKSRALLFKLTYWWNI